MPLFEYECKKCDHTFEALVFNGEVVECPKCQASKVERLLSVIAKPRESASPSSCSPSAPPCSPRCCRLPS